MNYLDWLAQQDLDTCTFEMAFKAGAASRDAEIAELKTVPMKYRRMAFNAQLQDEVAELAKERDQLRNQVAMLRKHLSLAIIGLDESWEELNESRVELMRVAIAETESK